MSRYIIKIRGYYLEWSTIVDAPITYGMTLEELKEYIRLEYGRNGLLQLPARLDRVEEYGTSCFDGRSVKSVIHDNRAGWNEETLTLDEIYEKYCIREEKRWANT